MKEGFSRSAALVIRFSKRFAFYQENYIHPLIVSGKIEMTILDNPKNKF